MSSAANLGLKDGSLFKTKGLINGEWVGAPSSFAVQNPANGKELGQVADMGVDDTKRAIDAASNALPAWSKTTAKERHDILMKFFKLMTENSEDLGRLITLENGKTLAEGKGENAYSASFLEWFAEEAVRAYGEVLPPMAAGTRGIVIKQPIGVVSILTPWNFPSAMITRKLGAALAAGCTVVIKPATETPFSALALADLAERAGVPKGVINVITTSKHLNDVAKEMCENPIVKKISFTGSTRVAKILAGYASGTLKKMTIEAGGNAPFIVFDDADIDKAVEGAIASKFRATGQTCVCANRFFIQSSIYADFAAKLSAKVSSFVVGDGLDAKTSYGPLIHSNAVAKVDAHVQDAISKGATVLVGGKKLDSIGPNFYAPTVLSDVSSDSQNHSEETFGPLATLTKFETEDEVVNLANNTEVGLAGYFYARDIGRIWRVAEKLEVGMVGVNTGAISAAYAPFGGIKETGFGKEGAHSIDEYMITKSITFGGL
ncbi:hypothetical protein M408DRAFT_328857 [Serendipita vermifera MAFF 305830]|uniref:Succinate-semialdehyde dehydrogenase n=1 Tax=Serendipita vermifera MAFF 305830 TaxID=933852 RepID=A0A0C2WU30_SERVB|nr:hypothetical protein M408DRAFT_328857 [Serendipita vermifera MAFF 305830]